MARMACDQSWQIRRGNGANVRHPVGAERGNAAPVHPEPV
ncbi:MAG: hypothetical protein QOF51_360, partial [Chloroflexota bacterium]|nr:hypothetical protein [Chloroflexota bacterium]